MSDQNHAGLGAIAWADLTVADAAGVRDFYAELVGWKPEPVAMGDYDDFGMVPAGGAAAVAGICHARGENAGLPPQWMIYITVADVEASARRCVELGGRVLVGPKEAGGGGFCVIQDPAGACAALYSAGPSDGE